MIAYISDVKISNKLISMGYKPLGEMQIEDKKVYAYPREIIFKVISFFSAEEQRSIVYSNKMTF